MLEIREYYSYAGVDRRSLYPTFMTPQIESNVIALLDLVQQLVTIAREFVDFELDPLNKSIIHSGWRPPPVNAATPNAALRSLHMTGQAVDLYDPEGAIDAWCMDNQQALKSCFIWLEHPSSTKGWSHWQTVAPKSGNRVFYP